MGCTFSLLLLVHVGSVVVLVVIALLIVVIELGLEGV